MRNGLVLVTDRGGHLHNAKMLLRQMGVDPAALLVTWGPELAPLKRAAPFAVYRIPYLFSWVGKRRVFNPFKTLWAFLVAGHLVLKTRPRCVVSLGAADVVPYCLLARLAGARVVHVECMNQVSSPSLTGRLLYPISETVYVQWPELLTAYGPKAKYSGWVLGEARG